MTRAQLCKDKHPDGRVCALYLDHYGDHKENHLRSSWSRTMKQDRLEELHRLIEQMLFLQRHTVRIDVSVALDPFGVTPDDLTKHLEAEFSGSINRDMSYMDTYLVFYISKKDQ